MRKLILKIIGPFLQYFAKKYFTKPREYSYKKIKGVVLPGVFYPHLTISTKLFMEFLEPLDINQKTFLELGCGSGFISVLAAQKGGKVLATDVNPKAIENVKINAATNKVEIETKLSNLFEQIGIKTFDFIVINPPYYPKKPNNVSEEAWFCGENFEYFEKLFKQLPTYIDSESEVYMILSEDCEFQKIQAIASKNLIEFLQVEKRRKWGEWNYIFQLKSI